MSEWGDMPRRARMTEAEAVAYVAELYRLEREEPDTPRAVVSFGPATAFVTIGALQLATRHPDMSEANRHMIRHVIDQLAVLFADTPGAELLEMGNDPELDVPSNCRYPFGSHAPNCPPRPHAGYAEHSACPACGGPIDDDEAVILASDGQGGIFSIHVGCAEPAVAKMARQMLADDDDQAPDGGGAG